MDFLSHFFSAVSLLGLAALTLALGLRWPFLRRGGRVLFLLFLVQGARDVLSFPAIGLRCSPEIHLLLLFLFAFLVGAFVVTVLKDVLLHWFSRRRFMASKLIRDLLTWVVYLVLVLFLLQVVYGVSITPFLAGSAVLTVVIGFAVQDTLINLIAGVVFHFEDSIRLGDWLEIDGNMGEVKEMSWRAIRLQSAANEIFVIPNQDFTKKTFTNLSRVNAARIQIIGASYRDDPEKVRRTLTRAALSTPGIRWDPKPAVEIDSYGDFAVNYRIRYFIEDYRNHPKIKGALMLSVWHAFQRHRISIPFPVRVVHQEGKLEGHIVHDQAETIREALADLEMFRFLEGDELDAIVAKSELVDYPEGTVVALEGEQGLVMFVIVDGKVEVTRENRRIAQLGPGDIFGEVALFTGELRKASVKAVTPLTVVTIHKVGFENILKRNTMFISKIEKMVEDRLSATTEEEDPDAKKERSRNLLRNIRCYLLGNK